PDAALGLLVVYVVLVRRVPAFLRARTAARKRWLLAHVGLFLAFECAALAGWMALYGLDTIIFAGHIEWHMASRVAAWKLLIDVLIYGTLLGAVYAWQNAEAVREQAARAARAETLQARAALEAMRARLHPHFILNTFQALMGLVRRDPALAETALERLGDLLRHSLRVQRDGIDEVPLGDECTFVDRYLELE